ncbi:threonine/homoserine/homoserine lactone efflux protein [Halorubrum distributum JCM 9100]|uniref:Threonine/homoserine/homoserine lactone efflux protein n=2 Tax=Halorubrum distributum TaxID=29283 RepID=M0ETY3_9EURY|nr:LysE family translocator [Halorubrum distributum]ELZ49889.1 threonine/homoserine/homoserine lactone efflux protein [Halorubrum distributum JCM 9100]ELZ57058.1 threonine/homoserine/homoserine lactone efflux protein [Halorubrum distributum JCM 10118]
MNALVFDHATLATFISAAIVVIISPGPDTIYTLTESLRRGRYAGAAAACGTATGILVHTTAAVLGLAAILRTSALTYTVVKYLGAAYLVYLGVQTFRHDEEFEVRNTISETNTSLRRSYGQAVTINVSNPKVAVFVLAFFPQFISRTASVSLQMSILGLTYAALSVLYLLAVVAFASRVRHIIVDSEMVSRFIQYASGSVLIGFGLKLLTEKQPGT